MTRTMMRGIVSLALVSLTTAGHSCELESSAAVADAINSAMFIWAAAKRCKPGSAVLAEAPVKCEQDVASSIQSITAMSAAIAGMIDSCDGINKENHKCAAAANSVVSATAGLAAAGGAIADKCTDAGHGYGDVLGTATTLGKCTADAGSSMNSIFGAVNTLHHVKKGCDAAKHHEKKCTADSLDMVSVLASFGAYIAAAVEDCSMYHHPLDDNTE